RGNDTDMPPRSALILIDEVPETMINVDTNVGDPAEYLFLQLQAVLRRMAAEFLDIDVTHRLVKALEADLPELVAATIPRVVSWFELTDILRRLVDEGVSVGDLAPILESLPPETVEMRDTVLLAERARHALAKQITARCARENFLPALIVDPAIERAIVAA